MSDLLNQASLVMIPSGYKEDTVFSQLPQDGSGDLAFTRASNGTRVNSAGLVEVCPWNLLEYSNAFNTAPWSMNVTSGQAGKDGQNNAWLLTKLGSTTSDYYLNNVYNGDQTFTIYVKKESGKGFKLFPIGATTTNVEVNLQTGVVLNQGAGITSTTVEAYSSTWWKISVALNMVNSNYYIYVTDGAGTQIAGSITIQDAQVNIGLTAKPYFPTTDRLNVPRLTYQNGGGGCPSLLLEKQSTNVLKYSEQFDDSNWTKAQGNGGTLPIITANYGISPDGTQNADRIQLTRTTQTSSFSYVYQTYSGTVGVAYTWSIWLKSLSGTPSVALSYDGSSYVNIVTLTTEWQRYTFTSNAINTDLQATFLLFQNLSGTSLSADFLAWGFQIEASSYATSYIPTTSSSATRVADACFKTGISSLIGQTEGTVFLDFVFKSQSNSTDGQIGISNSANSNRIIIWNNFTLNTLALQLRANGTNQISNVSLGSFVDNTRYKIAVAYKSGNNSVFVNGIEVIANTASFTFSSALTDFILGGYEITPSGHQQVNQAVLFPTRLTNTELASLTTI